MHVTFEFLTSDKVKEFSNQTNEFCKEFLKHYRKNIREDPLQLYTKYPDKFKLMGNVRILIIYLNSYIEYFVYESKTDKFEYEEVLFETEEEYNSNFNNLSRAFKKEFINSYLDKKDYILNFKIGYGFVYSFMGSGSYSGEAKEFIKQSESEGKSLAEKHINSTYEEIEFINSVLDFSTIVEKLQSNQFNYVIKEAIKCYKNDLFFATVVTSGIAFENLIKLVLVKKNIKFNEREKLFKLIDLLQENGIIDKRKAYSLRTIRYMRNLSCHPNEGIYSKNDALSLLQAIKEIGDDILI